MVGVLKIVNQIIITRKSARRIWIQFNPPTVHNISPSQILGRSFWNMTFRGMVPQKYMGRITIGDISEKWIKLSVNLLVRATLIWGYYRRVCWKYETHVASQYYCGSLNNQPYRNWICSHVVCYVRDRRIWYSHTPPLPVPPSTPVLIRPKTHTRHTQV